MHSTTTNPEIETMKQQLLHVQKEISSLKVYKDVYDGILQMPIFRHEINMSCSKLVNEIDAVLDKYRDISLNGNGSAAAVGEKRIRTQTATSTATATINNDHDQKKLIDSLKSEKDIFENRCKKAMMVNDELMVELNHIKKEKLEVDKHTVDLEKKIENLKKEVEELKKLVATSTAAATQQSITPTKKRAVSPSPLLVPVQPSVATKKNVVPVQVATKTPVEPTKKTIVAQPVATVTATKNKPLQSKKPEEVIMVIESEEDGDEEFVEEVVEEEEEEVEEEEVEEEEVEEEEVEEEEVEEEEVEEEEVEEVEEEEVEEEEVEEEEEPEIQFTEFTFKGKVYVTDDETKQNGIIYKYDPDSGEVGDEIGSFKNGAVFFKKSK